MSCDCIVGHHVDDGHIQISELSVYLARDIQQEHAGYTKYQYCPRCGKPIDLDYWVGRLEYEYGKDIGLFL